MGSAANACDNSMTESFASTSEWGLISVTRGRTDRLQDGFSTGYLEVFYNTRGMHFAPRRPGFQSTRRLD